MGDYNYHYHQSDLSTLLRTGWGWFCAIMIGWILVVLIITFPWIILACVIIAAAAYIYVHRNDTKNREVPPQHRS